MSVFLDLTTVNNGRELDLLQLVTRRYAHLDRSQFTVVAPPRVVEAEGGMVLEEVGEDQIERWRGLHAALEQFLETAEPGSTVVSFHAEVAERVEIARTAGAEVHFVDARTLLPTSGARAVAWPDEYIPLDEAIKVMVMALERSGGSLRMTNIRPVMRDIDPKYARDPANPTPLDKQGTWGVLVRKAEERGLVATSGPTTNELVTLAIRVEQQPGKSGLAQQGFERESDRFILLLKNAGLGPFQQVRPAIYAEIARRLSRSKTPTVSDLLDRAVAKIRTDVESAQGTGKPYLVKEGQRLPWSQVRAFIGTLFVRYPVLVSELGVVGADWLHLDVPVTGLVEDWQLRLDSELVAELVRAGCRIDQYSESDLSGSLYNTRTDLRQVRDLLRFMMSDGKFQLDASYALKLK